jgi:hypothetical protein
MMAIHVATHRPFVLLSVFAALVAGQAIAADKTATIDEVLASPRDLWGEASLEQPGGPSYEFFEPLLPPLRYCDAPFRHYPIVLSAPGAPVKARVISNGSMVNALARQPSWIGETGTPVTFRVTRDMAVFGEDLSRLEGPVYEQGYLPIVQLKYRSGNQVYAQEAFAPVDPALAQHGVLFVRFTLVESPADVAGMVEAQIESPEVLRVAKGKAFVPDKAGKMIAAFELARWRFNAARCTLTTDLKLGESAHLAICTEAGGEPIVLEPKMYDAQRAKCIDAWNAILDGGTRITVPEKRVDDAWRATTIGNFMLLHGAGMRYSHGNQYAKLYIGEGGDTTRAMIEYGQLQTARKIIPPLFVYTRKGLDFHQAGLKLQMLAHYYWTTRDAEFVKSMRVISKEGRKPGWQTELDLLMNGREEKSGLFPPEKYAGDIDDRVYSSNSNSNGWRGLRDMAAVLNEIGEKELAKKANASAEQFRKAVLGALEKSIDRTVQPAFVPLALFGAEKPYPKIPEQRLASYWNIMSKFVLASGVFPPDSEYANALIDYAQQRGGLCMGMNRSSAEPNSWWINFRGINDLYTLRYTLTLLRRDEPDRALVGFYGKLAHGMTRDTFIGCEGSSIIPMYGNGRQMYLPPNSAANANFLEPLRYLLVQDYDMNDDGQPETLRLAFATSRRWLEDGKEIKVERAPTAFGEISYTIKSQLNAGTVEAHLNLPKRSTPEKTLLRLRLPDGWKIESVSTGDKSIQVNDETIDISSLDGTVKVVAKVSRK